MVIQLCQEELINIHRKLFLHIQLNGKLVSKPNSLVERHELGELFCTLSDGGYNLTVGKIGEKYSVWNVVYEYGKPLSFSFKITPGEFYKIANKILNV